MVCILINTQIVSIYRIWKLTSLDRWRHYIILPIAHIK